MEDRRGEPEARYDIIDLDPAHCARIAARLDKERAEATSTSQIATPALGRLTTSAESRRVA